MSNVSGLIISIWQVIHLQYMYSSLIIILIDIKIRTGQSSIKDHLMLQCYANGMHVILGIVIKFVSAVAPLLIKFSYAI